MTPSKTPPQLPFPSILMLPYVTIEQVQRYRTESLRVEGHRNELASKLDRIKRDTLCEQLQQRCSDWGVYWRAPDAHGVNLSHEQALELLRDALGVEVEIAAPEATLAAASGEISMRYFANGPEGSFMADDVALANMICGGFDREEWTITDTHESPASPPVARGVDHG